MWYYTRNKIKPELQSCLDEIDRLNEKVKDLSKDNEYLAKKFLEVKRENVKLNDLLIEINKELTKNEKENK